VSRPQGPSAAGRVKSIEITNELLGIRTRDLPACSTVPQPTTLPRAPQFFFPQSCEVFYITFSHISERSRGADKSLAFPISCFPNCSTTKRIFLGWVKEVRRTKS
jgi:hypothetical protein